MRSAFWVVLLVLGGCLGSPNNTSEESVCPASPLDEPGLQIVGTDVDPIRDDKENATVFSTYNIRTCSLPAIGWTPLRFTPAGHPDPHGYLGELDMRADLDLGAVAVVGSGEQGGVYVLDLTVRTNPAVLAYIPQPGAHVTDVKFSDDGKILYVASQNLPNAETTDSVPEPVSPVGFTAYNVEAPENPVYLGTVMDPTVGCHMLDPVQVAENQDAVFCVSQHIRSYLVQRDGPTLLNMGFIDYIPSQGGVPSPGSIPAVGDPTCRLPGAVPDPVPDPALCLLAQAPHDMTAFHEGGRFGAGKSYMVVSHWGEGVKVLDITEAPLITEVGSWNGEGATYYAGNVHTAMMFTVGEKRYIVASPEYTSAGTIPGLWVLEADNLGALKLVAEWYHPGNHDSQGLYLTTHQWQVAPTGNVTAHDVRIYLTYNHAGVWVLDFGAILDGSAQDAILGFNLARKPLDQDIVPNAILNTWDVGIADGYIYGTDRATGLWVFHYQGDELGDERLNGFA